MKHLTTLLLITVLSCTSCSIYHINSDQQVFLEDRNANRDPQEIEVLENVSRAHKVLGTIVLNTERNEDMYSILWRMKKEAVVMGGDAITNLKVNSTGFWEKVPFKKLTANAYIRANFTVDVVAYE
mgnify:CR=1 FL=1